MWPNLQRDPTGRGPRPVGRAGGELAGLRSLGGGGPLLPGGAGRRGPPGRGGAAPSRPAAGLALLLAVLAGALLAATALTRAWEAGAGPRRAAAAMAGAAAPAAGGTQAYSLWLRPGAGQAAGGRLSAVVDALAREHGGPVFPPHVTLAATVHGAEEAVRRAARGLAAAADGPVAVSFARVAQGPAYFQSVYLLADRSPALVGLHAQARAEMERECTVEMPNPEYMPHLSLMYGLEGAGPEAMGKKARIARALEAADGGGLVAAAGFRADSVQLWLTPPDPSTQSWELIEEFPLGPP